MLRLLSRELDAALSELRLCHNRAFMEMKEGWSWCRVLAGDDDTRLISMIHFPLLNQLYSGFNSPQQISLRSLDNVSLFV